MHGNLALDIELEARIKDFGRDIFRKIGRSSPSAFDKRFWSTKAMEWSMNYPSFKTNLFRLVDVFPTLSGEESLAQHVQQYLYQDAKKINPLIGWAMNVRPGSLRSKLAQGIVKTSIKEMASMFIAGDSPEDAEESLKNLRKRRLAFTVDLLGEFCVSEKEALNYQDRYLETLKVLGEKIPTWSESNPLIEGHPGETSALCISVKLSALYSHTSVLNFDRSVSILAERLGAIARSAAKIGAQVYVDAEDTGNNPVIYEAFKKVYGEGELRDTPYPGIVLQAYALGAQALFEDLLAFSKQRGSPIAIRLVKGAYWDHETISATQNGWPSPLFANKESSDANYELLTRLIIDNHRFTFPAFGSHNVRSLSHACMYAQKKGLTPKDFELQMLYGMADPIASSFSSLGYLVRMYVPLGEMIPGMGYLVRRLLENTSNESFLRHTFFEHDDVSTLLRRPEFKG